MAQEPEKKIWRDEKGNRVRVTLWEDGSFVLDGLPAGMTDDATKGGGWMYGDKSRPLPDDFPEERTMAALIDWGRRQFEDV